MTDYIHHNFYDRTVRPSFQVISISKSTLTVVNFESRKPNCPLQEQGLHVLGPVSRSTVSTLYTVYCTLYSDGV